MKTSLTLSFKCSCDKAEAVIAQLHSVEEHHVGYPYGCLLPHITIQVLLWVSSRIPLCYICRQQLPFPPQTQGVLLAGPALCHGKREPQVESMRGLVASELLK